VLLNCARAAAGTLSEIQASYFVIKSSHSGTPILSPALAVVVVVVVVAGVLVVVAGVLVVVVVVVVEVLLAEVAFEELVVVVSELPQAANSSAQETASDRETKILFSIREFSLRIQNKLNGEMEKRGHNTRKEGVCENLVGHSVRASCARYIGGRSNPIVD
jgi:hypothetical protein